MNGDTLVYIAGPYTNPDPCQNTHRAVAMGNVVWDAGFVPVIPHLTHFWHTMTPKPYADWLEYDLAVMRRCDAVLRIPGASSGADAEVKDATARGIPVFDRLGDLLLWSYER